MLTRRDKALIGLARRCYREHADDIAQEAICMLLEAAARGKLIPENAHLGWWISKAARRLGFGTGRQKRADALTHDKRSHRVEKNPDTGEEAWNWVGVVQSCFPPPDVAAEARILASRMPPGIPLVVAGEIDAVDLAAARGTSHQNETRRANVYRRRAQKEALCA